MELGTFHTIPTKSVATVSVKRVDSFNFLKTEDGGIKREDIRLTCHIASLNRIGKFSFVKSSEFGLNIREMANLVP